MGYLTAAQRFDVVSVGDVAMDVFIRLPEELVVERADPSGRFLELAFGAKIACARASTVSAGGDAANAAVALARLGLRVALASFVAHDAYGRDLLVALRSEGVATELVHIDEPAETNRNFVLWAGAERTILVHHQNFNYHWPSLRPSQVPAWLYLTSVGPNDLAYESQLLEWLGANQSVRLAFRPGTAQLAAGRSRLAPILSRCELVILTEDDAGALLGAPARTTAHLLEELLALGVGRIVLARADGGALAADASGTYEVARYPDASPPYERTGADDAFAATVLAGLVAGMTFERSLARAPVNAMSVTHELGAQPGLLSEAELGAYLAEARQPGPS